MKPSHPKLKQSWELIRRALTSRIVSVLIAFLGISLTASSYFDNPWIIVGYIIFLFLLVASFGISVISIVSNARISYKITESEYIYSIKDGLGNECGFTWTQNIILNRDTDIIRSYFPLDQFIESISPFSNFYPQYEGFRKKMLVYLNGYYPSGEEFTIKFAGKRSDNTHRERGVNCIEIPIDFPTDKLIVVIKFPRLNRSKISPTLLEKYAGEVRALNNKKQYDFSDQGETSGYQFSYTLDNPQYGHSYLVSWSKSQK